jgi:hypothetical protein
MPAFAADGLTLSSETEVSSGKYGGTEATDILFVPFVAKYESGLARLKLTVPYVEISGPGNVQIVNAANPGAITASPMTPSTQRDKASGLGDIVASASYNVLYDPATGMLLDIGGKIKFATASKDKGLGTGKNDYSAQADAYKSLGQASTLMATLGYTWMGKPEASNFRDVVFASAGLAYRLNADTVLSSFVDYRQSVVKSGPAPCELTLYISHRLDNHWKIQAYALTGRSDASPGKGIGASLAYSL